MFTLVLQLTTGRLSQIIFRIFDLIFPPSLHWCSTWRPVAALSSTVYKCSLQCDCIWNDHLTLQCIGKPYAWHHLAQGWCTPWYQWPQVHPIPPGPGNPWPAGIWWCLTGGRVPLHRKQPARISAEYICSIDKNRYVITIDSLAMIRHTAVESNTCTQHAWHGCECMTVVNSCH